jgi:hypothetical protein
MKASINIMNSPFPYSKKGFGSMINENIEIIDIFYKLNFNEYSIKDDRLSKVFNFFSDEIQGVDASAYYLQKTLNKEFEKTNNSFSIPNFENIKNKNYLFHKFFTIKNEQALINKVKNLKISENSYAFHIRGTDKINEIKEIEMNNILLAIDKVLPRSDFIFISTDDEKYLKEIYNIYGDSKIKHDESKQISWGQNSINDRFSNLEKNDIEAFEVAYTLSNFKNFCYSFSNLSHFALTLGVNNFSYILNLNTLTEGWA